MLRKWERGKEKTEEREEGEEDTGKKKTLRKQKEAKKTK